MSASSSGADSPSINETAVRDQYRLAEYTSVRAEWVSARDAQQSTLQWTLAALAVLLVGILTSQIRTHDPAVYVALSGGVVLLAGCAHAIWFGEALRMERAALFLRGVEAELSRPRAGGRMPEPPLRWETWRALPKGNPVREASPWVSKASLSIIGAFALYVLLAAAGLFILGAAAAGTSLPRADRHLALGFAIGTGVVYAALAGYMAREARRTREGSSQHALFAGLFDGIAPRPPA